MTSNYLTDSEMDDLISKCKELRKGHKLIGSRTPYTVIVDEGHYYIRNSNSLRKFLSGCTFPSDYRVFRNFDKGVTIKIN